ncbi:MAG: hypothetical protein MI924_27100 [Chloroflexales bacterium]|nr:hypothetical protein [Chloroflexales bacterium]
MEDRLSSRNGRATKYTERVDDVPLLLADMERLGLPPILDAHFPAYNNHQGLSLGWLVTGWLGHVRSQADHRLIVCARGLTRSRPRSIRCGPPT